ncbi:hypothetical protein NW762_010595 [Fusarium torreyae]|uniref:Cupin type-2 domain-containing protein n=1 Tax=Fusarium torreyae TaxID=1237075 RepID=A0A9W8VBI4_9HYPO|nr:hypothetical protein NW762_010595 [Fusarium torreyae]
MSNSTQVTESPVTGSSEENGASSVKTASALVDALQSINCAPLWAQMQRLNPAAPNPTTIPYKWDYELVRPYLLSAGDLITEKQAERRVLMLVNPKKTAPFTTDTLYAGLQLVQPHEVAPAHRHAAFAVRFIIEGKGGFTAVQGTRVSMRPRDVLVTPTWNWHDHGKKGADEEGGDDKPVIWLDGLDLPTFTHFPVHFNEHFSEARYPAEDADTSPIVYRWEDMEAKLNASNKPWISVPYLKEDGREIGRVIGSSAERLDASAKGPSTLETASCVYHVIQGSGCTVIEGKEFTWRTGDTFCIPSWHRHQSFADDQGTVYLYRFDDKPMLKALGLYRHDGQEDASLISD